MASTETEARARNAEYARSYRSTEAGRAATRRNNLRQKGISPERYDELFVQQDGRCAVCRNAETGTNMYGSVSLAVDHDHLCCAGDKTCGKCIRGLLCMRCNRTLGFLHDDPDLLLSMADYLYSTEAVYVSGAMTGIEHHNFPAFNEAAQWLETHTAWRVINPASLPEPNGGVTGAQDHTWYLRRDIKEMLFKNVRHVVRLPGWEASLGASVETVVGAAIGCDFWDYDPTSDTRLTPTSPEIEAALARIKTAYF